MKLGATSPATRRTCGIAGVAALALVLAAATATSPLAVASMPTNSNVSNKNRAKQPRLDLSVEASRPVFGPQPSSLTQAQDPKMRETCLKNNSEMTVTVKVEDPPKDPKTGEIGYQPGKPITASYTVHDPLARKPSDIVVYSLDTVNADHSDPRVDGIYKGAATASGEAVDPQKGLDESSGSTGTVDMIPHAAPHADGDGASAQFSFTFEAWHVDCIPYLTNDDPTVSGTTGKLDVFAPNSRCSVVAEAIPSDTKTVKQLYEAQPKDPPVDPRQPVDGSTCYDEESPCESSGSTGSTTSMAPDSFVSVDLFDPTNGAGKQQEGGSVASPLINGVSNTALRFTANIMKIEDPPRFKSPVTYKALTFKLASEDDVRVRWYFPNASTDAKPTVYYSDEFTVSVPKNAGPAKAEAMVKRYSDSILSLFEAGTFKVIVTVELTNGYKGSDFLDLTVCKSQSKISQGALP